MTAGPLPPYQWDENKRQETLRIRAIDFLEVERADWSTAIHHRQERFGEIRYSSYALIGARLYNVVWTTRETGTRVISMRKANRREIARYEQLQS